VNGTVAAAGAIVVLESKMNRSYPPQTEPPIMDQAGETFSPGVLFVRTGEPVEFRNSDDTLHNVHVGNEETREPAFNVAIPTGEKYTYTFQKDGFYHVGCDIHPAMSAEILATSTPFATLAEANGTFSFADVPPGAYTLRAFSSGRRWQQDLEVRSGVNAVALIDSEGSR
jgi:plastocyanin